MIPLCDGVIQMAALGIPYPILKGVCITNLM
jgi:hypothetical protein